MNSFVVRWVVVAVLTFFGVKVFAYMSTMTPTTTNTPTSPALR